MSLIEHSIFPRSRFGLDNMWLSRPSLLEPMMPTSLDIFDPFDELDRLMSRNLHWLNQEPVKELGTRLGPRVPEKYRVTLDCAGYESTSIKTEVKGNKLVVSATEGIQHPTEDYSMREFRRTFDLPRNVDTTQLVSFITPDGQLVAEFPIKERQLTDLLPQITDLEGGGKKVELHVDVPEQVDPSKISVTAKDRDIIIRANYRDQKTENISRIHYYRRATLPENTDMENLMCVYENNKLNISAPLHTGLHKRQVPVEIKQELGTKMQSQLGQGPQAQLGQQGPPLQGQLGQKEQEGPKGQKGGQQQCPTCKAPAPEAGRTGTPQMETQQG